MTERVTAADVARSLGLSRATVGFVLNDTPGQTISEATRSRVLAEAKRLGYRPHTAARALASGRSHIVLLLLPDWPLDHSLRSHLDEASLVLDQAGYSMVTMTPHPGGQAVPLWESLSPDVVLSLAPISDDQNAAIRATRAATIIAGRDESALGVELGFDAGPQLQVEHLLERGRRSIAFAGTSDPRLTDLNSDRRTRAAAALASAGRQLSDARDIHAGSVGAVVERWVTDGVDAVAAYNDDIAALVLGAAIRGRISVPGRLAIIGHDDTPLAQFMVPSLSSVRIDAAGLGRFLAELALAAAGAAPPPTSAPAALARIVTRETT